MRLLPRGDYLYMEIFRLVTAFGLAYFTFMAVAIYYLL